MSRGVKDLRDLICVSRLTIRGSDEECYSDDDGRLSHTSNSTCVSSGSDQPDSRVCSAESDRPILKTPDSGFGTNGNSQESLKSSIDGDQAGLERKPHPPVAQKPIAGARRKKKKKKRNPGILPPAHELPKATPLPPVNIKSQSDTPPSSEDEEAHVVLPTTKPTPDPFKNGNFDGLLVYMDQNMVSECLENANKTVSDLTNWIHTGENYVHFAHFWLTDFLDKNKLDIFQLEYSILSDQLQLSFASGRDSGKVKQQHINSFLNAVLKEYPGKLLSSKGAHLFLNYLDLLTSERHDAYRKLLSDVRCSTRNKQYAQWILAVRAFALVSIWTAVVNFFRRLQGTVRPNTAEVVNLSAIGKVTDHNQNRIYHAIRNGYLDVVSYFLKTGKVSALVKDSHNRSLIFVAVTYGQPKVINFLLNQVKTYPNINEATATGNTALHAAANLGNPGVTGALLTIKGIHINTTNPQCEDATPLHLAVMHGHKEVVKLLLDANVDTTLKMGDLTAKDIAQDFGHFSMLKFFP